MLFVDFPVCLYWPDSYTAIMKLKLIFSANNLQITVFTLVKKLLMMMNLHIFPNTIKEMSIITQIIYDSYIFMYHPDQSMRDYILQLNRSILVDS